MTTTESVIHRYIEIWNESDGARRRALIEGVFTEAAGYTDPLVTVTGRAAIDAIVAGAQEQFAGLVFSLNGPVDSHHNTARFSWTLGVPQDEPLVVGFDVAVIEDGKIREVYGFLDKVPATL